MRPAGAARIASACGRVVLLTSALVVAAHAGELSNFNDLVARANASYRSTVHYLHTGNAMVAGFELVQAREQWSKVLAIAETSVPDPYVDDARFAATLQQVDRHLAEGAKQLDAGDPEAALAQLVPVRRALSELRARNGIELLEDCILELNDASDRLHVYRRTPPAADDLAGRRDLLGKTAVYAYLLARCDTRAPPSIRSDAEFRRLMDGATASAAALLAAIDGSDNTTVVNLLRELRSFDRILMLRFG